MDWKAVSRYQALSEDLIDQFADRVDWRGISAYQRLSEDFIQAHREKLDMEALADNWSGRTEKELEQEVRRTGLYECHDGYFIGYKGVRKNRYGAFGFRFCYLPGSICETFADASGAKSSFGFSVRDRQGAWSECYGLAVPCKVYYKDVARVTEGCAVRCRKLTVLA